MHRKTHKHVVGSGDASPVASGAAEAEFGLPDMSYVLDVDLGESFDADNASVYHNGQIVPSGDTAWTWSASGDCVRLWSPVSETDTVIVDYVPDSSAHGVLLHGDGAPSAGVGLENDYYIDNTSTDMYGPKTGGAWGSATSLIGADGATSVFGEGYEVFEYDTETSTTSTEFDEHCSFTTASLNSGTYRIRVVAYQKASQGNAFTDVQVEVNDSGTKNQYLEGNIDWVSREFVFTEVLGSGTHDIDVDFRVVGAGTAYIKNTYIEIFRVS